MQTKTGDLWTYETDWLIIPTNCQRNKRGELIMGASVALEASRRHPGLAKAWRHNLHNPFDLRPVRAIDFGVSSWGCECAAIHPQGLFRFVTKKRWQQDADLDVIAAAAKGLKVLAEIFYYDRFTMPMPGVGLGNLDRADILAVIEPILPDNVTVLELPV